MLLDVPGAVNDGLEVTPGPVRGTVSVRARGRESKEPGQVLVSERGSPQGPLRYARVVPVGWDADVQKAKASLSDGVLTVTIPKSKDEKTS